MTEASSNPSDASCRTPLVLLFVSAGLWLLAGSVLGLISSIQFHKADFLSGSGWLTYGRVRPASTAAVLYGFCLQAGLGVSLWLLTRLGRTPLAQSWLVIAGTKVLNLGVVVGVLGILAGDSTGFEYLEMPRYAALLIFLGYLLMGFSGVLTFHQRRERQLYVSQWFLLAALFWFPWIWSTAYLLLTVFPVRGVTQCIIAWWYADNLLVTWLGLVGLAVAFYFVPKLTGRELHSRYLSLLTFWMLVLFGGWGGIPVTAPAPAWMPAASTVAVTLSLISLIAVALNVYRTAGAALASGSGPALSFILFGVAAFLVAGVWRITAALVDSQQLLHLTWYIPGQVLVNSYGFYAMVLFGAVYWLVPQVMGTPLPWPGLVRAHYWLAAAGVLIFSFSLVPCGVIQTLKMQDPAVPFLEVYKSTVPFLRASTVGDLLLVLGHLLFVVNLSTLAVRFYRARGAAVYTDATQLLEPVEVKL